MQLARIRIAPGTAPVAAAYLSGRLVPLGGDPDLSDLAAILARGPQGVERAGRAAARALEAGKGLSPDAVEFLSPTTPRTFLGLGYNYRALAAHEGVPLKKEPELFAKLPGCAIGHGQPVRVPRVIDKVDFEAELAVVIGRTARRASEAEALGCVGGYTICNDVTAKIIPRPPESGSVIVPLKAVDSFGPMGPTLVTPDEIPDPQKLTLVCRVNGEEKQRFSTDDMVHTVAQVIAYVSARITLEPGDVITTGTSLGIGIIQKPPVFLRPGDVMELGIEGYPPLRNRIEWES